MHTFNETTGPGVPAFLAKLWRLVEDSTTDSLISWSPDGKSFYIHNQAQFARELLPLNYKHNNMASFIRQLNMYGFHKITSIDNGGLKFDRDDMEFSHSFFQRGHPYLLEHIKRKIAHPKSVDDKSGLIKTETVNKVLHEVGNKVKMMRGRQDTLDSRFSAMKQENEALWREIAVLRQKHMKQQQIVNKLIQFLVTIVQQPTRTGLSGMGGNKRRYQLMINDTPHSSKMSRSTESQNQSSGPIIHDISEELLDDVAQEEADLMNDDISPVIQSPQSNINAGGGDGSFGNRNALNINEDENYSLEDAINDEDYYFSASPDGGPLIQYEPGRNSVGDDAAVAEANIQCMDDISDEYNVFDESENMLATPRVKRETERALNASRATRLAARSGKSLLKKHVTKKMNNNSRRQNRNESLPIFKFNDSPQTRIPQMTATTTTAATSNAEKIENDAAPYIKTEKPMYTNQEDFLSAEMPSELFDEENINHSDDPMIGGISLEGGPLGPMSQINAAGEPSMTNAPAETGSDENKQWALSTKPAKNDLFKLHTAAAVDEHLDSMQGELDSLKDLLRGEGIAVDPSTVLGKDKTIADLREDNPFSKLPKFGGTIDIEQYLKLFTDAEVLQPFGLTMNEKSNNDDQYNSTYGSELMTYQPSINCDLSELLDDDTGPNDTNYSIGNVAATSPASSVLNTPVHDRDMPQFRTKQLFN